MEGADEFDELILYLGLGIRNVYVFYARAWNYREFEQVCSKLHKNVIKKILNNYEEYGIFKNKA